MIRAAVALALALAGSAPGIHADHDGTASEPALPLVEVYIHAAGGDAVDLYVEEHHGDVRRFMRDVAYALGPVPDEPSISDYRDSFEDYRTAGAQFDGRLPSRSDGLLRWSVETARLSEVMGSAGYRQYELSLCLPDVDHDLSGSGTGERWQDEWGCDRWLVDVAAPARIDLTLRPHPAEYRLLVAGIVGAALIGALVAALVVVLLRRSALRVFGTPALVVAGVGAGIALLAPLVSLIALAVVHRPVTSLVLAHNLSVPQEMALTALPATLLAVPGTVLAFLALRAPVDLDATTESIHPPAPPGGPGLPAWLNS